MKKTKTQFTDVYIRINKISTQLAVFIYGRLFRMGAFTLVVFRINRRRSRKKCYAFKIEIQKSLWVSTWKTIDWFRCFHKCFNSFAENWKPLLDLRSIRIGTIENRKTLISVKSTRLIISKQMLYQKWRTSDSNTVLTVEFTLNGNR